MGNGNGQVFGSEMNEDTGNGNSSLKRTQRGFKLILLGAFVLLGGCISTLLLPSESLLYDILLYGLTSLGASLLIFGFYCVFE